MEGAGDVFPSARLVVATLAQMLEEQTDKWPEQIGRILGSKS
jgi:hypothetical protein